MPINVDKIGYDKSKPTFEFIPRKLKSVGTSR
jgi:hypothetical protein